RVRSGVANFDPCVRQWMSTVMDSLGSIWSCDHDHSCRLPASVMIANCHLSVSTRGVGPADSTGNPSVTYCPGGSLSSRLPRPLKPRLMTAMSSPETSPITSNVLSRRCLGVRTDYQRAEGAAHVPL